MSEQNKSLIRRTVEEVWNRRNFTVLGELITSDFILHSAVPGDEIRGREGIKQFYMLLHHAFPDIRFTIEDQIAEGERVVTHWTAQGTQREEFKDIPTTGKQLNIRAIDIDRIVDGKVVERWTSLDEFGLLGQLGILPYGTCEDRSFLGA